MTRLASVLRWVVLLLACGCLSGCFLSGQSQMDEQKEPHFLDGKRRQNALDYKGAIESFDKALQVNPNSASAHFELGCLHEKNEADPSAAIYHYERFLRLRPNAENGDVVKLRVQACKQELARAVLMGPETQTLQNEFEKLRSDNQRLRDELERYRAYYAGQPSRQTVVPANVPVIPRVMVAPNVLTTTGQQSQTEKPGVAAGSNGVSRNNTTGLRSGSATNARSPDARTHAVKAGETPSSIARQYGVKVDALMAVNPGLEARKMRVGQTLNIP
jgi:LysM repeat protein